MEEVSPLFANDYSSMPWTLHRTHPIALDNGEVLRTLRDVRKFILALPERERHFAKWERLAAILLIAAETGRADMIAMVTEQLRRALSTWPLPPVRLVGDKEEQ